MKKTIAIVLLLINLVFADSTSSNTTNVSSDSKKNTFYATYMDRQKWEYGSTLLGFFAKNNIPDKTYFNLPPEDKEVVADVRTDSDVFMLRDAKGFLLQAFLSLNQDTQVRIFYNFALEKYEIEIIPIISLQTKQQIVAKIESGSGPSSALYSATQDSQLNQEFIATYKIRSIMQKGDRVAISYKRKYRLGKPIGNPDIQSIAVESGKKFNYIFGYQNRYYDINGKEMTRLFLITPVKYRRISSRFSSGRKHPILGRIRPHYGVDLVAPSGTPVYAASDGRVTFAGVKGGYGNVVEIAHRGGIRTLYAHMSRIAKNARVGSYVRQGTHIGNVGTTGLSTGPHLHFGVYKNNKPINPLGQIKTTKSELSGKQKTLFSSFANTARLELDHFIQNTDLSNSPFVLKREIIEDTQNEDDS